jgi:hypothetical protein
MSYNTDTTIKQILHFILIIKSNNVSKICFLVAWTDNMEVFHFNLVPRYEYTELCLQIPYPPPRLFNKQLHTNYLYTNSSGNPPRKVDFKRTLALAWSRYGSTESSTKTSCLRNNIHRSESISVRHPVRFGAVCSGRCGLVVTLGVHITTELPSFINKRELQTCVGLRTYELYGNCR